MRFVFLLLACLYGVLLVGCDRMPGSQSYTPEQTPLAADELALILGVDRWRIKDLPKSDVPYYGIRVVALGADNALVDCSTYQQFGTSVTANGNSQVLIGIQREGNSFSGALVLGSRPNATTVSRFTFSPPHKDGGMESSLGLTWHDDRATLIRCVDEQHKTIFTICAELLRQPPR